MYDQKRLRLWPLGMILLISALAIAIIWFAGLGSQRQDRNLYTILVLIGSSGLTLLWFLLFSRASWRSRLYGLGLVLVLALAAALTVRFEAVSGDLIPKFRWAWSQPADAKLESLVATAAEDATRRTDSAHDFLGYLGSRGDGRIEGVTLSADWAAHPPKLLWRQEIGSGWSGFAVAGDYAVTQEQRGDEEHTSCYDLRSGETIWSHVERVRHDDVLGGPGPRATPTIVGDIVYSFGATGILNALDLRTGESIWRKEMTELAAASAPIYGFSTSPVVRDGRLVVAVGAANGRSVWSFDPLTGDTLWSSGDASAGYATPVYGTLAGVKQWVVFNEGSVNGYAAEDGQLLWSTAWPQPTEETAQPKILSDDRLLVSSGYGVGARLYQLSSSGGSIDVELIWESIRLKAKFSDFVIREGNVYGLDDGILTCVSISDGSRVWKGGRYGHGQLLLVEDKLLIQTEEGDLVLVAASPHAHEELARITVFERKGWNHPALAGSVLLIRNDQEVAVFELHQD